jgi:HK97 family phage major capsid protein
MTLLEEIRAKIKKALDERASKEAEWKKVTDGAEERGDGDLTDEEAAQIAEFRKELEAIDANVAKYTEREKQLEEEAEARKRADEARKRFESNPTETDPTVRVNEPLTYRKGGRHGFFSDAYRALRNGDFAAQDRLRQHQREMQVLGAELRDGEERIAATGAFGALVVPQFLVEEFAEVLRNSRSYINSVRRLPLPPEGMTVTIPRGETGSSTAPQVNEGDAVSNTDVDFDNDLVIPVRTFAGQQDVSRQSLERGTPGLDQLIYADLVADYAEQLDASAIAGAGTSGTHKGVLAATGTNGVTYTSASPTVVEAWPKLANAKRLVGRNRKRAGNLWVMTSTRWAWFVAALDGDNRPLLIDDPSAAVNAMGTSVAENFGEGQLVGTLQGRPVLVDDNIPENLGAGTNEDRVIFTRRQDQIIWEENDGMPRELRFEETNAGDLEVKLLVYGYSAFTAERFPTAVSIISGTGLVQPSF